MIKGEKMENKSEYQKAREIIYDSCKSGKGFTVSIPPQDSDADMLLIRVIDRCENLEKEIVNIFHDDFHCHPKLHNVFRP